MRAALAAHDEVLRSAIETHGGFMFKHTGDGVCAAFSTPRAAVDAAIAAQRTLKLPVRMGVATGEAELREGDYFGAVLNRAARVMAAGHGGQILVADSTAGLLGGADLLDLGPRRLRDVPAAVRVFQVRARGPQIARRRIQRPQRRELCLQVATSFIGRESELGEVRAAVKAHRLVTLTGVGGVGKTRLALEVAASLADEFIDGVWLFELAAVSDPAAVPDAVAAVLGITQQPGESVTESVAAALEGRVRLLLFDNCEHVRDAVAEVAEAILAGSDTVRILATSRERLEVADEQLWPVPSLDIGGDTESAAVNLFVERARSVAPRFSLAESDDATAVVEICRRLDGIPLAIELAASRMASMTPIEVRDRLDDRFRLLVGSRRGLSRHQTLRHAVAWSYDHLDEAEKRLLESCSVFAGGFDPQSACAVAGSADADDYATLNLLDALVGKSLLIADRLSGRTRFSMLETIREFAEEQLAARGEATRVRATHARYFAQRETDVMALWDSPDQRDAYTWFTAELANLRTAYRWAADNADLDSAAPIATYATLLGLMVENYEPVAWAEELIEPALAVDHPRLASLYVMASHCWTAGRRVEEALRYSDAGQLRVLEGGGSAPSGFEGWLAGVYVHFMPERAVGLLNALLALGSDQYAVSGTGWVFALIRVGSHAQAIAAAKDLLDDADATPNPWKRSFVRLTYGIACCDADPQGARDAMRSGLVIAQDSGNRYNETHLASVLGRLDSEHGDPLAAFDHLVLAIRNYYDSGSTAVVRVPLSVLAALLHRLGRDGPAATVAGFAFSSLTAGWIPGLHTAITELRDVLGEQAFESLAGKGAAMTTAEMVIVRLRPNRPGASRTERLLEIDEMRESRKSVTDDPRLVGQGRNRRRHRGRLLTRPTRCNAVG